MGVQCRSFDALPLPSRDPRNLTTVALSSAALSGKYEQRPLIPGQASANDVLNTLAVHGAVTLDHLAWGIHGDPQRAREMAHLGGKYWTN
jgi:hypothetical protein